MKKTLTLVFLFVLVIGPLFSQNTITNSSDLSSMEKICFGIAIQGDLDFFNTVFETLVNNDLENGLTCTNNASFLCQKDAPIGAYFNGNKNTDLTDVDQISILALMKYCFVTIYGRDFSELVQKKITNNKSSEPIIVRVTFGEYGKESKVIDLVSRPERFCEILRCCERLGVETNPEIIEVLNDTILLWVNQILVIRKL